MFYDLTSTTTKNCYPLFKSFYTLGASMKQKAELSLEKNRAVDEY